MKNSSNHSVMRYARQMFFSICFGFEDGFKSMLFEYKQVSVRN